MRSLLCGGPPHSHLTGVDTCMLACMVCRQFVHDGEKITMKQTAEYNSTTDLLRDTAIPIGRIDTHRTKKGHSIFRHLIRSDRHQHIKRKYWYAQGTSRIDSSFFFENKHHKIHKITLQYSWHD